MHHKHYTRMFSKTVLSTQKDEEFDNLVADRTSKSGRDHFQETTLRRNTPERERISAENFTARRNSFDLKQQKMTKESMKIHGITQKFGNTHRHQIELKSSIYVTKKELIFNFKIALLNEILPRRQLRCGRRKWEKTENIWSKDNFNHTDIAWKSRNSALYFNFLCEFVLMKKCRKVLHLMFVRVFSFRGTTSLWDKDRQTKPPNPESTRYSYVRTWEKRTLQVCFSETYASGNRTTLIPDPRRQWKKKGTEIIDNQSRKYIWLLWWSSATSENVRENTLKRVENQKIAQKNHELVDRCRQWMISRMNWKSFPVQIPHWFTQNVLDELLTSRELWITVHHCAKEKENFDILSHECSQLTVKDHEYGFQDSNTSSRRWIFKRVSGNCCFHEAGKTRFLRKAAAAVVNNPMSIHSRKPLSKDKIWTMILKWQTSRRCYSWISSSRMSNSTTWRHNEEARPKFHFKENTCLKFGRTVAVAQILPRVRKPIRTISGILEITESNSNLDVAELFSERLELLMSSNINHAQAVHVHVLWLVCTPLLGPFRKRHHKSEEQKEYHVGFNAWKNVAQELNSQHYRGVHDLYSQRPSLSWIAT